MHTESGNGQNLHNPPLCKQTGEPMFLLDERTFAVMGNGDIVHRKCPFSGAPLTVTGNISDGEMTYVTSCNRCNLLDANT